MARRRGTHLDPQDAREKIARIQKRANQAKDKAIAGNCSGAFWDVTNVFQALGNLEMRTLEAHDSSTYNKAEDIAMRSAKRVIEACKNPNLSGLSGRRRKTRAQKAKAATRKFVKQSAPRLKQDTSFSEDSLFTTRNPNTDRAVWRTAKRKPNADARSRGDVNFEAEIFGRKFMKDRK